MILQQLWKEKGEIKLKFDHPPDLPRNRVRWERGRPLLLLTVVGLLKLLRVAVGILRHLELGLGLRLELGLCMELGLWGMMVVVMVVVPLLLLRWARVVLKVGVVLALQH